MLEPEQASYALGRLWQLRYLATLLLALAFTSCTMLPARSPVGADGFPLVLSPPLKTEFEVGKPFKVGVWVQNFGPSDLFLRHEFIDCRYTRMDTNGNILDGATINAGLNVSCFGPFYLLRAYGTGPSLSHTYHRGVDLPVSFPSFDRPCKLVLHVDQVFTFYLVGDPEPHEVNLKGDFEIQVPVGAGDRGEDTQWGIAGTATNFRP